jgi:perosamine synthetase
MNSFIPVYKPDLNGNEKKYLNECIDSTWISSKGVFIDKFENEFCKFTKINYSTTVSNGTVAIHLALKCLGITKGDEVLVPTFTYIASVNPILEVGAEPIFVDSREEDWQLDPVDLERKITKKTKAIMVVHLYGHASPMDEIMEIAKKHNLKVIEDCAEAFGSKYNDQHVGNHGDISTFSFFGNKTITCGEGGMVSSNNKRLIESARILKSQGVSDTKQYWHDCIAYNYRMTNMQAAIGLAQIERAEKIIAKKRKIASWYKHELSNLPIKFHEELKGTFHSYWMVSILLNKPETRDLLRDYLKEGGVETRPFFFLVDDMPMYKKFKGEFPVAHSLSTRGINLPSWPGLSVSDVQKISNLIRKYFISNI